MLRLIYGLPGSGKTHYVLEALKRDAEAGIRAFLIVPEQETVSAERESLLALPPSAQLTVEVLNFSRLANRIFRVYGGLSYRYADKGAKAFLMHRTVRALADSFGFFDRDSMKDASFSEWLLSAFSELKAACITPAQLDNTVKELKKNETLGKDEPLCAKLSDLAAVYATFSQALNDRFADSADDLTKLDELLGKRRSEVLSSEDNVPDCSVGSDFFAGTHVYVDSFTSFTRQEQKILERILQTADELTVTLAAPAPHAKDLHLHSVVATAETLRNLAKPPKREEIFLTGNHRAKTETLALLAESIWHLEYTKDTRPTFPKNASESVVLAAAPSVYEEAEDTAMRILDLVRKGYRYRDIAVITRDASRLAGILDFVFDKYGIPYYISEKEDLISLPPMKLLLSTLRVLAFSFRTDDVLALLKTGLLGVSQSDADLFEEYVTAWSIAGTGFTKNEPWDMNPDGYTKTRSERAETILPAANRVREKILPPLLSLAEKVRTAKNVAEECEALLAYLKELSLSENFSRLANEEKKAGHKKSADVYTRADTLVTDLIRKLGSLSSDKDHPDAPMSPEELESAIRILLRAEEVGTIPTAVDEVTIGSAHMLRAGRIRCAILVGLCEGEFPAAVDDSGVFSEAERVRLKELDKSFDLSGARENRASDELLYVSRAMAAPSDLLVLSTHRTGADGTACRPSMPWLRAALLLGIDVDKIGRAVPTAPEDRALTPSLSLEYYPALKGTAAGEALRRIYREIPEYRGLTEAADLPVSDTDASVPADYAKEIFKNEMRLSQSKLEQYVKCHFSYYCTYVLKLRESGPMEFGANNAGDFIHCVLERFLLKATETGSGTLPQFTREEIETLADEIIDAYKKEILPPAVSMEDAGRLPHLYRRLRELSVMMVENILEEFSASEFTPRFFELNLTGTEGLSPLVFRMKDGSTLTLPGIIDRVDLMKKDGTLYIRIVDYKTGVKDFTLADLEEGLNTQMLIYLFSLCHAAELFRATEHHEGEILPAGALYHSSALSEVKLEQYPEEGRVDVRALAEKNFKRTGVLVADEEILRAMNRDLDKNFLPGATGKRTSKGSSSSAAFLSADKLRDLEGEIAEVITDIAETMRAGDATAKPYNRSKFKTPCRYCKMRPVCRLPQVSGDDESEED